MFFDPRAARGAARDADVDAALRGLAARARGRPRPHSATRLCCRPSFDDVTRTDVAAQFGEELAAALADAPLGRWFGPVSSAYGAHLVRVRAARAGQRPRRSRTCATPCERDVQYARAQAASDALYDRLRAATRCASRSRQTARPKPRPRSRSDRSRAPDRRLPRRSLGSRRPRRFGRLFRPAYLELRELDAERYDVLLKVPAQGDDVRLAIDVRFPEGTVEIEPRRGQYLDGRARRSAGASSAPDGLVGTTVEIVGRAAGVTDVLARVERLDGTSQVESLPPGRATFVVEPPLGFGANGRRRISCSASSTFSPASTICCSCCRCC